MHGDRCNPSLPLLPSVCYPPAQPLIATDPPSRLWTHTALQCAFMLVDFRRFWCHNEGGWHFDMAPREFHALCVSNRLRLSAGRYSRNWSFIAFAWGRGRRGRSRSGGGVGVERVEGGRGGDYPATPTAAIGAVKAAAVAAAASGPFAPLNLRAAFLTPSNLKPWLKSC